MFADTLGRDALTVELFAGFVATLLEFAVPDPLVFAGLAETFVGVLLVVVVEDGRAVEVEVLVGRAVVVGVLEVEVVLVGRAVVVAGLLLVVVVGLLVVVVGLLVVVVGREPPCCAF